MMKEVLGMLLKHLGECTFVADVEDIIGKERAQGMIDSLLREQFIKYCGCSCGGFMITEKGINHLEENGKGKIAVWKTQDGLSIRVTHMSNEHIVNAINWLLVEQTSGPEETFSDLTDEYEGVMIGTWLQILSQEIFNRIPK